jgi:hypothetical protein
MLFDTARHEPLRPEPWDAARAQEMIERIVAGTEDAFVPGQGWATHPLDGADPAPLRGLYFGDCGVLWALHCLQARGAVRLRREAFQDLDGLRGLEDGEEASYLMGETGVLLLRHWLAPGGDAAAGLARLIERNLEHPARELMWGSPGTMLAALFLHQATGDAPWSELFTRTARRLWSELLWSAQEQCHYWTQDLYGRRSTYLDAVHGFVATASVLIAGRALLAPAEWQAWSDCIRATVLRTAEWDGRLVNWRARLDSPRGGPGLMQYCHGAPGFVACLADSPDPALDAVLHAAGETTWEAGPLRKGANLCHGTGGNGYAFLKLHRRFGDAVWLERARAFAMHGIRQAEAARAHYGQWRHALWTGDPGFALYLLDCIRATDRFPTLDYFRPPPPESS